MRSYVTYITYITEVIFIIYKTHKLNNHVETERKLNVHKTFRRRLGCLLNVLCLFNLRHVSTGYPTNTVRRIRNQHSLFGRIIPDHLHGKMEDIHII